MRFCTHSKSSERWACGASRFIRYFSPRAICCCFPAGFSLMLVGNVISAALSFVVSRKLARNWVAKKIAANPKLTVLDKAIAREGWKMIFWSQLHPLFPTSLLMYFYGATQIDFWRCMLWATLARAPGLFLYAYFGTH